MLKPTLIVVAGLLSLESVPVLGKTILHFNQNNKQKGVFTLPQAFDILCLIFQALTSQPCKKRDSFLPSLFFSIRIRLISDKAGF